MTYEEVLQNARKNMAPNCRVCRECNGVACRGEIPGVGAKGNASGFTGCVEYLASVKIHLDTLCPDRGQDTSISLFGRSFAAPIFAAPIGGMKMNYNGYLTEDVYNEALIAGTLNAGIAAFTGDYEEGFAALEKAGGAGIPTVKPWDNDKALLRIRRAEAMNAMAVAMDVDAAGLINLTLAGTPVTSKSKEELAELIAATHLPFVVKGVMTAQGALKAAEAGAYAIVVSSHGGRVLFDTLPTCKVLPEIRAAVGNRVKVFVDGGIRSGGDVFKAIALGADAVLIGRPFTIATFGGLAEGVERYAQKLITELSQTMIMTGCSNLAEITRARVCTE